MFTTHFDAVNRIWTGPKSSVVVDKHENLGDLLLEKLNTNPEFVAQINGDTGETLTKSEIRTRSIRFAQNITKLGCTQNDFIAVVAQNHHNLTPLLFGSICIGAPVSPLDVLTVKDGVEVILDRLRPSFIFCDAAVLGPLKHFVNDIGFNAKFFIVNGSADGYESIDALTKETGEEDSFVCTKLNDVYLHAAVIACSSGSTGLPKSICLSHAAFILSLKGTQFELGLTSLCFSSMYWASGLFSLLSTASKSKRLITHRPFSPDIFFDFVEKYKVQSFLGPPGQMQAILTSERCQSVDLSSLMMCFLIGSTLPTTVVQALKKAIPECILLSAYGMTEANGVSCTMPNELNEYPNSSGRLLPGATVKIINQLTGEKCGIGEEGEIYVKTPIPSMGYYKDEAATRNAFDSDGFFITGDLGYFDETGHLYVVGRKKEIFKCRGFSIWPGELENIILKHPGIRDCSVVGIYEDQLATELPAAVVVKKEDSSITEDDVYNIVADQLANYKRLEGGVYFVDKLPMTPSGKIVRLKAKEIAQNIYQQRKLTQKL